MLSSVYIGLQVETLIFFISMLCDILDELYNPYKYLVIGGENNRRRVW